MSGMATLRDLGLSEYESRVYRALLSAGPATAKELSRRSDVPMGRIYDVLNALEAADLIRSQQSSRPKKYAPVEPETALSRLLEEKRREMNEELTRYEEDVEEVAERLETREPADGQFYTVALGLEDSVTLLTERIAAATESFEMVVAEVSAQYDLGEVGATVADEVEAALERGVTVSALVAPEIIEAAPDALNRRYAGIMAHPSYEARALSGLAGSFNLIDRTEVCIGVANPLEPKEALALIALRDSPFARNLYEEFEPRWEAAEPLDPSFVSP